MNIGGGEAADQLVRMMLAGSEVAVRLSGSGLKNMLALTLALAKNHKTISGKVNLVKMLKETRDVRRFAMSPEQYQAFKKKAGKQKILFSAIRDTDGHGKVVDVGNGDRQSEYDLRAHPLPRSTSAGTAVSTGASLVQGQRSP